MLSTPLEYHQLENRVLPKLHCKNYYRLFIEELATELTAIQSWMKYFPEVNNWKKCFAEIYKSSKDNKLKQFSFKALHRGILTKKELKKYHITTDDTCPLCPSPDSIEHTFIHCNESTNFFRKTSKWFNDCHRTCIQLSNKQILLNLFDDSFPSKFSIPHENRLRILILLQKKYLHTCKSLT